MELTENNAIAYLEARGIPVTHVAELGGGISNTVVLVEAVERSFVLKQSLAELRVKEKWLADRSRIFREMESMMDAATWLPDGCVPEVLWVDRPNYLFAMEAVNGPSWKNELLAGRLDPIIAARAGSLLGTLIRSTWEDRAIQMKYGDLTVFNQLRIDPYYRTIAGRHRDIRDHVLALIEDSKSRKLSLVHGDFSPKNILIAEGHLTLVDFEVVHFGDPSFDAAFCLSLILLGWFYQPQLREERREIARVFFNELVHCLPRQALSFFESALLRHLGCLMLARIDGKSPVEYITKDSDQTRIRSMAKDLIVNCPKSFEGCLERVFVQEIPLPGSCPRK